MKKLFIFAMIISIALASCESDNVEPSSTVFTEYDTEALTQTIDADDPSSITFSFRSKAAWSITAEDITKSCSWITIEPMSGEAGECQITISIDPNTANESRLSKITLAGDNGGDPLEMTLTQEASSIVFTEYDPDALTQSVDGDDPSTINFSFTSKAAWSITAEDITKSCSWVTIEPMSGEAGECQITINVDPNLADESRLSKIKLAGNDGGDPLEMILTQEPSLIVFTEYDAEALTQIIDIDDSPTISFSFRSRDAWSLSTEETTRSCSWITVEPMSGEAGENQITIKIAPNIAAEPRFSKITLAGNNGGDPIAMTLTQNSSLPSDGLVFELARVGTETYLKEGDNWIITDTSVEDKDSFYWLCYNINQLNNTGRSISLYFPNLTEFPDFAFRAYEYPIGNAIKSITAFSATSIGSYAFKSCVGLTTVSLPEVISVKDNAFVDCTALTSASLPKATSIGEYAFYNCGELTSATLPEVTLLDMAAFRNCHKLSDVFLPKATTIKVNAFWCCNALSSISLPEATAIDGGTFLDCANLISLSIPKIETFDWACVAGSNKLSTIALKDATYIADNGIFFSEDKSTIYKYFDSNGVTQYTAPESVTTIGNYAFGDCNNLTSVSFPGVTTVDDSAFEGCDHLASISLPLATSIGVAAFNFCINLESISLPKITSIGDRAFARCYILDEIELATESTLTSVGAIFEGNDQAEEIDLVIGSSNTGVDASNKTWSGYTFKSITLK